MGTQVEKNWQKGFHIFEYTQCRIGSKPEIVKEKVFLKELSNEGLMRLIREHGDLNIDPLEKQLQDNTKPIKRASLKSNWKSKNEKFPDSDERDDEQLDFYKQEGIEIY